MKKDDKNKIQQNVDYACGGKIVQRSFGIADSTENAGSEIVKHDHRHACKVDAHVEFGQINDVDGGSHDGKDRACGQNTDHGEHNSQKETQGDGSMDGFLHTDFVFCGKITCGQYVDTDSKTHKGADQKIDYCGCGADGRDGIRTGKLSYNDDIGCIKQKLQNSGKDQRYSKFQDAWKQWSCCHINFIIFFLYCHGGTLSES